MKEGELEGLESDWDSPGLGKHSILYPHNPTVGERFNFKLLPSKRWHSTSPVQRLRREPGKVSFITKHTTYILTGDL